MLHMYSVTMVIVHVHYMLCGHVIVVVTIRTLCVCVCERGEEFIQ